MSIFPGNSVPSGTTETDRFARELALLLGWNAPDLSLAAEDLRAWGGALADAHNSLTRASEQFFASSSTDLLAEWEFRLGIPTVVNAPIADRQAAVAAKRAAGGGDVKGRLLKAVQRIEPTASIVRHSATSVATTNPRNVFKFTVVVPRATIDDPFKNAAIRAVIEQMKPTYSDYELATSIGFRFGISLFGYDTF